MSVKDKFKATKLDDFQEQMNKGDQFINNKGGDSQGWVDKIEARKFDDGKHKFRIWPAHEDTKSFAIPFVTVWLPAYVYDRDDSGKIKQDKEGNYIKKKSKKPIFNAREHAGTNSDIVEEYVRIAKEQIENNEIDDQIKQQKLDNLNDYKNGLVYKPDYVMYASEVKKGEKTEIFILQVTNGQMKKINKVAAMQDEDDEVLETDPFTDPEIGRCLVLQKNSQAQNNSDKYIFNIDTAIDKETQKLKLYPLSKEELEKYDQLQSLEKRFGSNVYTKRDFNLALEGIQMYDKDNNLDVIQTQEFQEIAQKLEKQYPEPDQKQQNGGNEEKQESKDNIQNESNNQKFVTPTSNDNSDEYDEEDEDESEEGDQFDSMSRVELKAFIKKNGYAIKVSKKLSDDDLRQRIRDEQEVDDLPWKDQEPNENDVKQSKNDIEEESESEPEQTESSGSSVKEKLQKFKQKNKE